jgi:hypothetical protein
MVFAQATKSVPHTEANIIVQKDDVNSRFRHIFKAIAKGFDKLRIRWTGVTFCVAALQGLDFGKAKAFVKFESPKPRAYLISVLFEKSAGLAHVRDLSLIFFVVINKDVTVEIVLEVKKHSVSVKSPQLVKDKLLVFYSVEFVAIDRNICQIHDKTPFENSCLSIRL